MTNYIIKHLKLLKRYSILSFKRSMEYHVSFYFDIFNQIIKFTIWLIFWDIILKKVGAFQGWDYPMMVLLIGFYFVQEAVWIIFWRNWNFFYDIINGYITVYLVRPINPYLGLIWKYMDVMRIGEMIMGIILIAGAIIKYDIKTSIIKVTIAFSICILGAFIMLNTFAIVNALCFWFGRVKSFRNALVSLFIIEKTPLTVFPGAIKAIYTFALPLIFIATYPVLAVTSLSIQKSLMILGGEILLALSWYAIFGLIWSRGLRRFESFGG